MLVKMQLGIYRKITESYLMMYTGLYITHIENDTHRTVFLIAGSTSPAWLIIHKTHFNAPAECIKEIFSTRLGHEVLS